MAFPTRYDAVDASVKAHGLAPGGPPFAVAAAVLLDKAGAEVFSADDLPQALENLLDSAGAAAAIAALITGTDLSTAAVLTTLATNLGANATEATAFAVALLPRLNIVSNASPLTTESVTASASKRNETCYVTPAGTIAAMTFVFPSNANSQIGQEITLSSTQIVTTLTVSSSGLTLLGTAVTALAANVPIVWRKVAASTWLRIQ